MYKTDSDDCKYRRLGVFMDEKKEMGTGAIFAMLFDFLLVILLLGGIWSVFKDWQTYYDLNQEQRMTYTHYLMLGLNNNRGVYTKEDCEISQNEKSVKRREEKNWEEIKNDWSRKALQDIYVTYGTKAA